MNWQEYKSYHKSKYGSGTQSTLSHDYQSYKNPGRATLRSPTRYTPIDYERLERTMPESRIYKTNQLLKISRPFLVKKAKNELTIKELGKQFGLLKEIKKKKSAHRLI